MASRRSSFHWSYDNSNGAPPPGRSAPPVAPPAHVQGPIHYQYHPDALASYPGLSTAVDVERIALRLHETVHPSLQTMHDVNLKLGSAQGAAVAALSKQLIDMRAENDEKHKQLCDRLENMQKLQVEMVKSLSTFTKQVGKVIGLDDRKSLLSRLDEVVYTVGELLERSKDPDANATEDHSSSFKVPEIIVLDHTPEPELVSAAPQTPRSGPSSRIFTTALVSTTPHFYTSTATTPLTPTTQLSQRVFSSTEVCTSPAEISPPRVERGVSPIEAAYMEAAVDATSTPSEDVDSSSSSGDDAFASSSCRQSSATTLVEDGTILPHLSPNIGKTVDIPTNFDDVPALEYIDDSALIHNEQSVVNELESYRFRGHCKAKPDSSNMDMFSPVDWSKEDPSGTQPSAGVAKKQMAVFRPDTSPQFTKSFSLLKDQGSPPDGTIASLRRDALGDSFAGPLTSTPRPTSPYYSRPSVSPMPSPASSRSPSPLPFQSQLDERDDPQAIGTSYVRPSANSTAHTVVESSDVVLPHSRTPLIEGDERKTSLSPTSLAEEEHVSTLVMQTETYLHDSSSPSIFEDHLPSHSLEGPPLSFSARSFSPTSIPRLPPSSTTNDSPSPSTPLAMVPVTGISPDIQSPATRGNPVIHTSLDLVASSPPVQRDEKNVARSSSPIYISSASPSPAPEKLNISLIPNFPDDDDDTPIIPATKIQKSFGRSKEQDTKIVPPRLNLLAMKSRENKAATRVKKRKDNPKVEEEEPPLKRARQRKSSEKAKEPLKTPKRKKEKADKKETSQSSKKRGKQKKSSVLPVKWPAIQPPDDESLNKKFIKCDMCLVWYHYGCVGIGNLNDRRLKDSSMFVCPPCDVGSTSTHPVQTDQASCARPDCKLGTTYENEFYVAGVIGRKTKVEGGYGRKFVWLLKWEGYPVSASTWESEESMSDPLKLIEDFEEAATKEGWNLEEDPHCSILLQEARDAGWQTDEDVD
ncbi:hypothetical protein BDQ17DRAFT_1003180 [Cyathus striatus]|nr:hypothetical protein BDQ17DRAFT_1003180 [Cyathus striatus]